MSSTVILLARTNCSLRALISSDLLANSSHSSSVSVRRLMWLLDIRATDAHSRANSLEAEVSKLKNPTRRVSAWA